MYVKNSSSFAPLIVNWSFSRVRVYLRMTWSETQVRSKRWFPVKGKWCSCVGVFDKKRQWECALHRVSLTGLVVVSDDCYAAGVKSCQREQARKRPHKHTSPQDVVMDVHHRGLNANTRTSSSLPLSSQLNETAKQLMEIDKPTPTNAPGPSSEPAPLGSCAPGPSPCASPSNGNGSGHRRGEGKKNAKKRHSFSALSVSQRAAQLNNRHSMEISCPVLISSSDPRAAARIQVHSLTRTYNLQLV